MNGAVFVAIDFVAVDAPPLFANESDFCWLLFSGRRTGGAMIVAGRIFETANSKRLFDAMIFSAISTAEFDAIDFESSLPEERRSAGTPRLGFGSMLAQG